MIAFVPLSGNDFQNFGLWLKDYFWLYNLKKFHFDDIADFFTAKLKLLNVKVVRIFSEQLVHLHYPLPNFPKSKQMTRLTVDESYEEHRDVALHELIRKPDRPFAQRINQYDRRFRDHPEKVDMKEILDYKKLLGEAYHAELGKAEVILCTCGSSGNNLYKKAFHEKIQQVCSS